MNKPWSLCLVFAALWCATAIAQEPEALPKKALQSLQNFEFSPDRNITFQVNADAGKVYYLARSLMLELDYALAAEPVSRGDLLGPFVSLRSYADEKLKEIVMIQLQTVEGGVQLTIRGLYVMPANKYMLVRSKRKPSRVVRSFPALFKARLELFEQTQDYDIRHLLDQARENLATRHELETTLRILEQIKDSTVASCAAGRDAREMLSAISGEIDRRKTLEEAVRNQKQAIETAMTGRDWLAAHQAVDKLLHILYANAVAESDPDFIEARRQLDVSRLRLRGKGVLLPLNTVIAPAEGNNVAVGFTVVNVGNRPIAGFKVAVNTTTGEGKPSPGRIGSGYTYSVEIDPPLQPDEYYSTTVVLNFEHPSDVAAANLRIVNLHWAKASKNHH